MSKSESHIAFPKCLDKNGHHFLQWFFKPAMQNRGKCCPFLKNWGTQCDFHSYSYLLFGTGGNAALCSKYFWVCAIWSFKSANPSKVLFRTRDNAAHFCQCNFDSSIFCVPSRGKCCSFFKSVSSATSWFLKVAVQNREMLPIFVKRLWGHNLWVLCYLSVWNLGEMLPVFQKNWGAITWLYSSLIFGSEQGTCSIAALLAQTFLGVHFKLAIQNWGKCCQLFSHNWGAICKLFFEMREILPGMHLDSSKSLLKQEEMLCVFLNEIWVRNLSFLKCAEQVEMLPFPHRGGMLTFKDYEAAIWAFKVFVQNWRNAVCLSQRVLGGHFESSKSVQHRGNAACFLHENRWLQYDSSKIFAQAGGNAAESSQRPFWGEMWLFKFSFCSEQGEMLAVFLKDATMLCSVEDTWGIFMIPGFKCGACKSNRDAVFIQRNPS